MCKTRLIFLTTVFICLSGCLDVAPKAEKLADVKANVEAKLVDMNGRLDASNNKVDATGNNLSAKLAELNSKIEMNGNALTAKLIDTQLRFQEAIQQTVGQINGQNNAGMFAGGGVYVTVVCVSLILGLVVTALYLLSQRNKYRGAYLAYSEALENQQARSAEAPAAKLERRLRELGVNDFVSADLTRRGLAQRRSD